MLLIVPVKLVYVLPITSQRRRYIDCRVIQIWHWTFNQILFKVLYVASYRFGCNISRQLSPPSRLNSHHAFPITDDRFQVKFWTIGCGGIAYKSRLVVPRWHESTQRIMSRGQRMTVNLDILTVEFFNFQSTQASLLAKTSFVFFFLPQSHRIIVVQLQLSSFSDCLQT